jgi:hypothetical protein
MRMAAGIVLLSALTRAAEADSAAEAVRIDMWTRADGQYGQGQDVAKGRPLSVDLDRLGLKEGALVDAQYGGSRTYRYVPLEDLIRRYAPSPASDTALLHFANGMAIPVPFRDTATMRRLRPVVVRAIRVDGAWASALPPISRTNELYFDTRPLRFQGNKVAVAEDWHPALRPGTAQSFSPWRHADTLTGVEFVRDAAFVGQFDVDASTHRGLVTYEQVCRFCHGARKEGAQFGWDFVEPIPISEYRKKDVSLYYHVKFRPAEAVSRGLLMPALPFLTQQDAADLLAWIRALSAKALRPYGARP